MNKIRDKIWHIARFLSLIILILSFIFSLVNEKSIKIYILISYILFYGLFKNIKSLISILTRLIILILSIIFFKLFSSLFYYNLLKPDLISETINMTNQILNISNSIFFSALLFVLIPQNAISSIKDINNFISNLKLNELKSKKIDGIKINSLSSFFAYLIDESYKIYYQKEKKT